MAKYVKLITPSKLSKISSPRYAELRKEILRVIGIISVVPGLVSSVNGRIGPVTLTSADVNLGSVDNTSDLDKPISTATQTALDLKQDKYLSVSTNITNRTLALTDVSKILLMDVASPNTVTVPTNGTVAFPIGTQILIAQKGLGQTSFAPAVGVTINVSDGRLKMLTQFSMATLIKTGTNEWYLSGDLTA